MSSERHHGGWVIILSFIVSFMLAIIPLPAWAVLWRPDWVALVLIYWCIAVPQRVGVATGWFVGVIYDVLKDTLLGQNALSLCFIGYVSVKWHRQVRLFPLWQQAIGVFGLLSISHWIEALIYKNMLGYSLLTGSFISQVFISMILWPWVFVILRDMRRTYRVY
ncbi:rod shape-determining protein MreD [Beggiatoa sp. PS]|nr:rod shape-determining protein MreD [Beggiatoa sp. PS]